MAEGESGLEYEALIQTCDLLIRSGRVGEVAPTLEAVDVPLSQTPRKYRGALARICRRVGLVDKGLRLLQPVIRNEKINLDPATPAEISEYAVLLSRFGSVSEALDLLSGVDGTQHPEAFLFEAFCQISRWEYGLAVPLLERYLASDVDEYAKTVARVNLASAQLVISDLEAAERTLEDVLARARETNAIRLLANALEIRAQIHLQREDFANARNDLELARTALGGSGAYDAFFVAKWTAALTARESKSVEPLTDFRAQALARGSWESVREADLFALKIEFNQARFDHLLFGTSLRAYRARILSQVPHAPSLTYRWGEAGGRELDFDAGLVAGENSLRPGQKLHQLFTQLLSDFYVPQNLGALYAALYPGEPLDIDVSIARVRQILKRARSWLAAHQLPLTIAFDRGGYRLVCESPVQVQLSYVRERPDPFALRLNDLRAAFPHRQGFKAEEACRVLALSRSSFARWLEQARTVKCVEEYGEGKSSYYRLR